MASSPVYTSRIPERSINGYYAYSGQNVFAAAIQTEPWVEYDFGKVVQIQKVVVKIKSASSGPTHFENVEVKISNSSASPPGDFSTWTLLGQYPNLAVLGEVIVFETTNPIWGRYLSFQRTDTGYMNIAMINVLGKD